MEYNRFETGLVVRKYLRKSHTVKYLSVTNAECKFKDNMFSIVSDFVFATSHIPQNLDKTTAEMFRSRGDTVVKILKIILKTHFLSICPLMSALQ